MNRDSKDLAERRTDDRAGLLYELCCAFAERTELDELVPLVMARCRESLGSEGASVLLLDAEHGELYFPYVATEDQAMAGPLREVRFPSDHGIAGAVLRDGKALRIDDVAGDPRFFAGADRRTGSVTRAMISAPLRGRHGPLGVIQAVNPLHGGAFSDDDLDFLEALAGSVSIAIENARFYRQLRAQVAALERAVKEHNELLALRRELQIARDIQRSILPRVFPAFPERSEFEVFAAMRPANEVGGDFYDFFLLGDDRLGIAIGDVSGKGVPAALFMAVTRTLLRSVVAANPSPAACLGQVNRLLCRENEQGMFVTLFYGVLDFASGAFAYSNAGHNPPWLLRASGHVESVAGTGDPMLGAFDDTVYHEASVALAPGDVVFLYTDGVSEGMNVVDEPYSDERLEKTLRASIGRTPESLVSGVVSEVQDHGVGRDPSDDITAMALRWLGPR
jgi:serine phosphatase RsbU (regulator of sigma subunit)